LAWSAAAPDADRMRDLAAEIRGSLGEAA
jgi:hypothetical protein